MRIVIIGNSHAGPIYTAWKSCRGVHNVAQLDFYIERSAATAPLTMAGSHGEYVTFENIRSFPDTALQVDEYDAAVIVGLGLGFHAIANLYRVCRSDAHVFNESISIVSDSCYVQLVTDVLASTKAGRVLAGLKQLADIPCVLVPAPFVAEWIRQADGGVGELYKDIERNRDGSLLLSDFTRCMASMGEGVTAINQPTETVAKAIFTKNSFCRGDPAVGGEDSYFARGDYYHGNVAWAASVIAEFLVALQCSPAGRQASQPVA